MAYKNTPVYIAGSATATDEGTVQLAGDLGGTSTTPRVVGVNGVAVTNAPASGQILTATDSANAHWSNAPSTSSTAKRVVTAANSSSPVTPNGDVTDIFRVTLTGNPTLNAPSGSPIDGQQMQVHIIQDGTGSRTVTWGSGYQFSSDIPAPTLTTTAGATDILGFQYSTAAGKWRLLGIVKGF